MKKFIISVCLLLSGTSLYAYDIIPKLSLDLPGTFRSDYEVDVAVNLGAEARYQLSDYFSAGVGFDYLFNRNISLGEKAERDNANDKYYCDKRFSFLPVYLSIIFYPFGNFGEYKPYLRLDGGYNILFSIDDGIDSTPGAYYAGAIGFELFEKYIFELYASRYEAKDNGNDITYKNIYFKLGYKFTI